MVARFAWLCVVEFVIAVILAIQVFGGTNEVPTAKQTGQTGAHVKTVRLETAGTQDPGVEEPPPPPPEELTSPSPPRTAAVAKWRPNDPAGIVLLGTVRLRDGSPADAYLGITREKDRKGSNTEKDGTFAIVGLHPGEWDVTLHGESVVQVRATITLGDPTRQGVQIEDRLLSRDNGMQQKCALYPGRYTAIAITSNGVGMVDLDTASSPPQVRFVLQPAATLELELGNPDTITSVVIAKRSGAAIRRLMSVRKSESITLPPDDYSATIIDQAGVNTRRDFTLTAAGFQLTQP